MKYQLRVMEGSNGFYESYVYNEYLYDTWEEAYNDIPEDWQCFGLANRPFVAEVEDDE